MCGLELGQAGKGAGHDFLDANYPKFKRPQHINPLISRGGYTIFSSRVALSKFRKMLQV